MENRLMEPQHDKIAEAVLTLIESSEGDRNLGETKLVKLLYYADCEAYRQLGKPITGLTYLRYPHGPYPKDWQGIRETLEDDGDVVVRRPPRHDIQTYVRNHWINQRSPKDGILTVEETEILQGQVKRFASFNGRAIENYSHEELGWSLTPKFEPIPYAMAGFSDPSITTEDLETARRIAADVVSRRTTV